MPSQKPGPEKSFQTLENSEYIFPRLGTFFRRISKESVAGIMPTKICDMLKARRWPLLSFEFFPPKDDAGLEALEITAEQLKVARPDFVTVTYGAGGSTRERTFHVCDLLRDIGFDPVMPHLTCVGESRAAIERIGDEISDRGFNSIMVLRGDPPKGETVFRAPKDGLAHASDLVRLLKTRHPDFCCGVAGYPETHPEAESPEADIRHLKEKLDAGADFVTTQLFFENQHFTDYVLKCRKAGIQNSIIPGLLPAISVQQAQRMAARCKAYLPPKLVANMQKGGGEGDAAEQAGIQWAVAQVEELLRYGVPGIHLYVLNRAKAGVAPALLDSFRRRRP
jgi:methylenetetrahydrofolate reductase (NADPH)